MFGKSDTFLLAWGIRLVAFGWFVLGWFMLLHLVSLGNSVRTLSLNAGNVGLFTRALVNVGLLPSFFRRKNRRSCPCAILTYESTLR